MKLMKNICGSLIALLIFSSSANAFIHEHSDHEEKCSFAGFGMYVDPTGAEQKYGVALVIEYGSDGLMKFTESYISQGEREEYVYSVANTGKYTFDVFEEEGQIGSGYCFKSRWKGKKKCHMTIKKEGMTVEKTIKVDMRNHEISRMGSKDLGEGGTYIFKDNLWKK